jgi:hypothetical protein
LLRLLRLLLWLLASSSESRSANKELTDALSSESVGHELAAGGDADEEAFGRELSSARMLGSAVLTASRWAW